MKIEHLIESNTPEDLQRKIDGLRAMINDRAASEGEKANATDLLNKLQKKLDDYKQKAGSNGPIDLTFLELVLSNDKLKKNLEILQKRNAIEIVTDNLKNIKYGQQQTRKGGGMEKVLEGGWDGTLYIKLKSISNEHLVNYILGWAKTDEMSIQNNILRLWWD